MTLVVVAVVVGILFLLSVIFRTALLPLRLSFVSENKEKEYLVNLLVRVSFRRRRCERAEEEGRRPSLRHRRLRKFQTKIVTILQDRGWWYEKTQMDVENRLAELDRVHDDNAFRRADAFRV